jgi:hypothetical protein
MSLNKAMGASRRFLRYLIEDVPLGAYLVAYFCAIVVFAVAYWLMPSSDGLSPLRAGQTTQDFVTSLYFSETTITTVCYGDVVPIGYSRGIACVEAFLGLTFMGVMLAKITSMRLSYHVLRLFSNYAESRLGQFCTEFERMEVTLKKLLPQIAKAFPETPQAVGSSTEIDFLGAFSLAITDLHSSSTSFCEYLNDELEEGFFLADAPSTALVRSGVRVQLAVYALTQVLLALSPQAKIVVLAEANFRHVREVLEGWKGVSAQVVQRSRDVELQKSFNRISEMCAGLAESFFTVPSTGRQVSQPDQSLTVQGPPPHQQNLSAS